MFLLSNLHVYSRLYCFRCANFSDTRAALSAQVTARAGELQRIAIQLERLIDLYQRRVAFLTGGSRRLFGLVMEHAVTVVLDFQVLSVVDFVHFTRALETLVSEQVRPVLLHCQHFTLLLKALCPVPKKRFYL